MHAAYDPKAPRRATNLSINSDLLRIAKKLDINLSATLEEALVSAVKSAQRQRWLRQNRDAMVAYNEHVGTNGVFTNGLRGF